LRSVCARGASASGGDFGMISLDEFLMVGIPKGEYVYDS
jgi:hypothetical protein